MASLFKLAASRTRATTVIAVSAVLSILFSWRIVSEDARPAEGRSPAAVRLADLANQEILESSGLAVSRRNPAGFWTHNDSGDVPRIFAFDRKGAHLGCCTLRGAEAIDWEDMASFQRNGKSWLLIGDVGDNGRNRKTCQLYLCEEPDFADPSVAAQRIDFQYENGPHNCESIAVDPSTHVVLLTAKVFGFSSQVFELSLPEQPSKGTLTARAIASIPASLAVSMDISPDGRQAIVLTYADAMLFSKEADETWGQAFSRSPRRLKMPQRTQGETVCFQADGRSVLLTSEKLPTPLWEVRMPEGRQPD